MRFARGLFLFAALFANIAVADINAFTDGSLDNITTQRTGKPFLLVLWSVDCSSCLKELDMLKDMRSQHPQLDIVLISADGLSVLPEVQHTLASFGLGNEENWIFSDSFHGKLRYQIDSNWYGELPRAYLYAADHSRKAVSGALDRTQLADWAHQEGLIKRN